MLKKPFRKSVIVGGCALLTLSTLAACGGDPVVSGKGEGGGAGEASGPVTVTLSVMTSNRFLEYAKQQFEAKHENISIEIKEYVAAPPTDGKVMIRAGETKKPVQDIEKFVSGVNTELMSGKAADIIITDGSVPLNKYADKKLLENMNDLMTNDASFQKGDYYANVFDAMTYNNGLYALPAELSLGLLLGNKTALGGATIDDENWTWADFKAAVEPLAKDANNDGVPDLYALNGLDASALLLAMVNTSYGKLVDLPSQSFDKEAFASLLTISKALSDAKLVADDRSGRTSSLFQLLQPVRYEDLILNMQMAFDGEGELHHWPSDSDQRGVAFTSDMLLSLNAKSAHKQEAWEFIKFLLSEEMQKTKELSGFAVNKKASRERQEQLKDIANPSEPGKKMAVVKDGKPYTPRTPEQHEIDQIEQLLSSAQVYAGTDPKVIAIIEQEVAPFFAGQKPAEEVAKTVQQKVSTYLQE